MSPRHIPCLVTLSNAKSCFAELTARQMMKPYDGEEADAAWAEEKVAVFEDVRGEIVMHVVKLSEIVAIDYEPQA